MNELKMKGLYKEYLKCRFLNINFEQFVYLVTIFPSLIVLKSDGVVDKEEWDAIKAIVKIIARQTANAHPNYEEEENLNLIYCAEIRHLLKNQDKWENKFLIALKEHLLKDDEHLEFVQETMHLFAYASKGMCPEEKVAIKDLCHQLDIEAIDI